MARRPTRPKGALNPYSAPLEARQQAQAEEEEEWEEWDRKQAAQPAVISVTVGGEPVRSAPEEVPESPEGGDEA